MVRERVRHELAGFVEYIGLEQGRCFSAVDDAAPGGKDARGDRPGIGHVKVLRDRVLALVERGDKRQTAGRISQRRERAAVGVAVNVRVLGIDFHFHDATVPVKLHQLHSDMPVIRGVVYAILDRIQIFRVRSPSVFFIEIHDNSK